MTKFSFMIFISSSFLVTVVLPVVFIVGTLLISSSSHKSFVRRIKSINISHLTLNTHTITTGIKETPISLPNSLYSCREQVRPQARNKQNNMTLPVLSLTTRRATAAHAQCRHNKRSREFEKVTYHYVLSGSWQNGIW